jgi:Uncharacterized protein conserved in bacteria (DUF2252)
VCIPEPIHPCGQRSGRRRRHPHPPSFIDTGRPGGHRAASVEPDRDAADPDRATLARAHARSGDPVAIAAYLGKRDEFDRSITDFSQRYAKRNEMDYQLFADAVRSGRLEAIEGV